MKRALLIGAALLAPSAAWAEPATIGFILGAAVEIGGIVITVQQLLVVGLYVYGAARARRKARSAQAKAQAEYNANLQDRSITALQALPPWRIVPGRAWVGGDIHAIFTTDKTGYREDGSSYTRPDALKHLVVVFADHQCAAIHDLAIDGVPLGPLDGSGFVTAGSEFYTADTDSRTASIGVGGSVTVSQPVLAVLNAAINTGTGNGESSSFTDVTGSITLSGGNLTINGPAGAAVNYTVDSSVASVRVQKHLGTSTQTVDTYLNSVVPAEWTSTDRLLNKTYCVITLDLENQRFQGGQLGITADISGRLCYDPRKDSTVAGGSGAHRANDPTTWEWTDNAAIAGARDYLSAEWGFGNAQADIDEAYTQVAANACDVRASAAVQAHAQTFTVDAATNELIFAADELYGVGDGVRVSTTTTLPGGLAAATTYYVIRSDYTRKRIRLATSVANAYAGTAIDITSAGSGTHTCTWHDYATYKVNGAFLTEGGQKEAVLDDLTSAMGGDAVYGAQWQIIAGAWTAPVTLPGGGGLVDDDLAGQISIVQADTPLEQLVNGVRGTYIPTGKATPTEYSSYSNSTFVTDDGQELWADLPLEFVDNPARARNLARILVETSRNGQIIQYPAKLRAWPLQVGDRITVTSTEYGFSAKEFRVTDWQFGITSPVVLTLQEDTEAAWDLADAAVSDQTLNTGLPSPWVVQGITLGTLTSGAGVGYYSSGGAWVPRIRVPWSALTGAYLADGSGHIVVRWRAPGSVEWQELPVQSSETSVYISGFRDGDPVVVEVYAVNGLGQPGPSAFAVHTVAITGNGAIGGGNLLVNSSFEVDSNADGLADGWVAYNNGSNGTITNTVPTTGGVGNGKYQNVAASSLGTATSNNVGIRSEVPLEVGGHEGRLVSFSAAAYGGAAGTPDLVLRIVWYDATAGGGTAFDADEIVVASVPAGWARYLLQVPVPAGALSAHAYVWMQSRKGSAGTASMAIDQAQLEFGVLTAYSPRADEILAGAVGTGQLANGAVTTPILATDSAAVSSSKLPADGSVSWGAGTFDLTHPAATVIDSLTYTNSTGRTVRVEMTAALQAYGSGWGGTALVNLQMRARYIKSGTDTSKKFPITGASGSGGGSAGAESTMAFSADTSLADGDTLTFQIEAGGFAELGSGTVPAGSVNWKNASMRITAVLA